MFYAAGNAGEEAFLRLAIKVLVVPHVRSYATSHDGEKDLSDAISQGRL